MKAIQKRLGEELAKLDVRVNEAKTRIVDLVGGGSFGFLGFEFRRLRSRRGKWGPRYTPMGKKRTALLRKLKDTFKRFRSQPVTRMVECINPILRGWVNYFRMGHSSRCFSHVRSWVEKKIRRHLMRSRKRRGFGWNRWSSQWIYDRIRLFNDYRVRYFKPQVKALPSQ